MTVAPRRRTRCRPGRRRAGLDGVRAREESGFTLVEVLAATSIFAVVAVVALMMILRVTQGTRSNDLRVAAAGLADRQIEATRGTDVEDIPDGLQVSTATVGRTTFTIRQNASLVASGSATSLCGATSNRLAYKLVTVTVEWPGMGTVPPVRADTLKAIGPNVLDPNRGTLAVQVSRANARPAEAVPVTLVPGGTTVTTGADGCAVFSQVPVGTVVAQVNSPGLVGVRDTQAAATGAVAVAAGEVTHADLLYDTAASVTVRAGGPATAMMPSGLPLMMRSAYVTDAVLPACGPVTACTTGFPGQVRNLFPTQRTFWAGSCHDARTPSSMVVVDVPTAGAVTVPLATVTVVVTRNGRPVSGQRLYAVHAADGPGTAVPSCPSGANHALPNSRFSGVQVRLPYGTWTFSTSPSGARGTTVTLGSTPAVAWVAM